MMAMTAERMMSRSTPLSGVDAVIQGAVRNGQREGVTVYFLRNQATLAQRLLGPSTDVETLEPVARMAADLQADELFVLRRVRQGLPSPTAGDHLLLERLQSLARRKGLRVQDYVVAGQSGYFSLRLAIR